MGRTSLHRHAVAIPCLGLLVLLVAALLTGCSDETAGSSTAPREAEEAALLLDEPLDVAVARAAAAGEDCGRLAPMHSRGSTTRIIDIVADGVSCAGARRIARRLTHGPTQLIGPCYRDGECVVDGHECRNDAGSSSGSLQEHLCTRGAATVTWRLAPVFEEPDPGPTEPSDPATPPTQEEVLTRIQAAGIPPELVQDSSGGAETIVVGPYDSTLTAVTVQSGADATAAAVGVGPIGAAVVTDDCSLVAHPAPGVLTLSDYLTATPSCVASLDDPRWAPALRLNLAIATSG